MKSAVLPIQHSYSIYAGDFHLHTLGDVGPFQNPAFAAGYEHSALRSVVAQSVAPAYLERLLQGATRVVRERMAVQGQRGDDGARFTGIVGLGDYLDMACSQERDMLLTSAAHMAGLDADIKFTMMVPGNHDGGQYMGSLWSKDNLFGLPFVGGHDLRQGACGCGRALSVADRVDMTRQLTGFDAIDESVTWVDQSHKGGFNTIDGGRYSFDQAKKVFDLLWRQVPGEDRWEAVMHCGRDSVAQRGRELVHQCEGTGTLESPDVQEWIHLQARCQETFRLPDGTRVPVYQLGLDTQDLSSAKPWQSSILGHVSELQVGAANNFIEMMLKKNPNAKFKIVMHYPVSSLSPDSQKALAKLLDRDEVILVVSGHKHRRAFEPDLHKILTLPNRQTALPQITAASVTDQPSEVMIEEMIMQPKGDGQYMLVQNFFFENARDSRARSTPARARAQAKFKELQTELNAFWDSRYSKTDQGKTRTSRYGLLGNEWVLQNGPEDLRAIAGKRTSRFGQVVTAIRMLFRHGKDLADYLTVNGSIPQMVADYHIMSLFMNSVVELLLEEGQASLADQLSQRLAACHKRWILWRDRYQEALRQKKSVADCVEFNNLFTETGLQDCVDFMNRNVPLQSAAREFMLLVGEQASFQTEAFYKNYGRDTVSEVPSQLSVVQSYQAQPQTEEEQEFPLPAFGGELLAMAK